MILLVAIAIQDGWRGKSASSVTEGRRNVTVSGQRQQLVELDKQQP